MSDFSVPYKFKPQRFFTDFGLTEGRNSVTGSKPTAQSFSSVRIQILLFNPKNIFDQL